MKRIYDEYDQYVIVEKNGRYGLEEKGGAWLLPAEYDSIFPCTIAGFLLVEDGKFGFIQFAMDGTAKAFLPCIYDYIVPKRHGLSLHQNLRHKSQEDRVDWFDFRESRLCRNMCHHKSFRHYDSFLRMDVGATMPILKKAGEESYISVPFAESVEFLDEIPVDGEADYFICCEFQPTDDEAGFRYDYFLLTAFEGQFTVSRSYTETNDIYNDMPSIIKETQKWIEKMKK